MSSSKAKSLASLGAELHEVHFDDPELGDGVKAALGKSMEGIDVVVNALGVTNAQVKDMVAEAAINAGAKVYFPSEFGVCVLSFPLHLLDDDEQILFLQGPPNKRFPGL